MRRMDGVDRLAVAALAIGDIGVGLFLIGVGRLPGIPELHALVGVLALLLSLPAIAAVIQGTLPPLADEGVLVNVGVMVFISLEVLFLPADIMQKLGLAVLLFSATVATTGLYFRLFGRLRRKEPLQGRHHDT